MMKSALHPRVITLLLVLLTAACTVFPQEVGSPPSTSLVVSGGLTFPVGNFSSIGFARTGGGIGLEAVRQPTKSTEIGVAATFNIFTSEISSTANRFVGPTQSDNWLVGGVYGLTGWSMNFTSASRLSLDARVGIMYGRSPKREFVTMEANPVNYSDESSGSSIAFSYGFSMGITIEERVKAGVDLLVGEPEYEITSTSGAVQYVWSFRQQTSIVQLRLGYVLPIQ